MHVNSILLIGRRFEPYWRIGHEDFGVFQPSFIGKMTLAVCHGERCSLEECSAKKIWLSGVAGVWWRVMVLKAFVLGSISEWAGVSFLTSSTLRLVVVLIFGCVMTGVVGMGFLRILSQIYIELLKIRRPLWQIMCCNVDTTLSLLSFHGLLLGGKFWLLIVCGRDALLW